MYKVIGLCNFFLVGFLSGGIYTGALNPRFAILAGMAFVAGCACAYIDIKRSLR